jgi:hypothetical protein
VLTDAAASLRKSGYVVQTNAQGEVSLLLRDGGKDNLDQLRHHLHVLDPALDCTPALPSIEEVFAGMIHQRQVGQETRA